MADPKPNKAVDTEKEDAAAKVDNAKVEAPYPSQAQLDAIREGKQPTQKRDVKAEAADASYQTR